MAGEMTEREAILAARVKELEDAAAASAVTVAQGGVFESLWRTINSIVSPWLAAVALAVFLAHYGFAYYLQGQTTAAETQLKQARADVATARARVANQPVDGVPMRLATLKAETEKALAEAAAAKASATALKAQVNGETAALRSAKAQLDNLQNQARLAQTKADAESARFGLSTLEDRAVRAKLITQQLKTVEQNEKAAVNAVLAQAGSHIEIIGRAMVRGECLNNQFAEAIGCPSEFVTSNRQPQGNSQGNPQGNPQLAAAPSDDNGQYWKVPNSCAPAWRYFRGEAAHGAFAVTKYTKGGGCGWSWSPSRPIEAMRHEAMATCAKYGPDCKIISEK
jgi:hypothetical protein